MQLLPFLYLKKIVFFKNNVIKFANSVFLIFKFHNDRINTLSKFYVYDFIGCFFLQKYQQNTCKKNNNLVLRQFVTFKFYKTTVIL